MLTKSENLQFLDTRISELNLRRYVLLAFDFDELVIPVHLTRIIAQKVSKPADKKVLEKAGHCSFEGIQYLNSLMYGLDLERYKQVRDNTIKEINWTIGFDTLLQKLSTKYSIIFISSGMKDICEAKLKEIDFDTHNILGSEFKIKMNKIADSKLIISDYLKGYIIQRLKRKYKVIAIGHSQGDKFMLDNSDTSISVNTKIPNLAKFNVNSAEELLKLIENNC